MCPSTEGINEGMRHRVLRYLLTVVLTSMPKCLHLKASTADVHCHLCARNNFTAYPTHYERLFTHAPRLIQPLCFVPSFFSLFFLYSLCCLIFRNYGYFSASIFLHYSEWLDTNEWFQREASTSQVWQIWWRSIVLYVLLKCRRCATNSCCCRTVSIYVLLFFV